MEIWFLYYYFVQFHYNDSDYGNVFLPVTSKEIRASEQSYILTIDITL
jgi:hypothetical protein